MGCPKEALLNFILFYTILENECERCQVKTETAVQSYWNASLTWRGKSERVATVEELFGELRPLEIHRSLPLQRQATELSDMIVKFKRARCPKPRKKLHNLVALPIRRRQTTIAA